MQRRTLLFLVLAGAALPLPATGSAQERRAADGAVVVRPVRVREVRVDQPAPAPLHDQRPTFGVPRPVDPAFISRPVPRPHASAVSPRASTRRHDRRRSDDVKPRLGVVVGYPVIYPYAYPADPFSPSSGAPSYGLAPPSPNTYSNVDTLSAAGSVTAASPVPGAVDCEVSAPCGGVSLDIAPATAQVYVDGLFAGVVEDFDGPSEPLLLAPGSHYVEVRLPGYRTVSLDVPITSGQVVSYQGALERLRLRTP